MYIVIDANVIKDYFKENVLGYSSELTASTAEMVNKLGSNVIAYVDDGGQIQKEWEQLVDPEWFTAWFAEMLANDRIIEITPVNSIELRKRLSELGFPVNTKDMWYIKTAKSVSEEYEEVFFITEDIDFFDPTQKNANGDRRLTIIKSSNAPVTKYLRKKESIYVNCVENFNKIL